MALNFNRPASPAAPAPATTEITEVKPYDIVADQQATKQALAH